MLTLMKGMMTTLRKKGKSRLADEVPEAIPASPELIALKADLGAGQGPLPDPKHAAPAKPEEAPPGPDPALADAAKSTPTRHAVAVLSLSESGDILSARGSCVAVFGCECPALAGKNISVLLKGRLDNELGQFLAQRRAGAKTSETVVLRVTILRQDGSEFPVSVTTPTWSLGTRLTQSADSSHLGWTFAFRSVVGSSDANGEVRPQTTAAPARNQAAAERTPNSRAENGSHPPERNAQPSAQTETAPPATAAKLREEPTARRQKNGDDWFESEGTPSSNRPAQTAPPPVAPPPPAPADERAATKPASPAESPEKIWFQRQVVEESNRRIEELQARLAQKGAELERVKAELEKQRADRERAESEWRGELDTVAKALGEKLQTANSGLRERENQSVGELAAMRKERDALKQKLEAEQKLGREAQQRLIEAEKQLHQAAQGGDSKKAEAGKHTEERSRLEFELRAQLEAAREAGGYTEAALREETLRREKLDQINRDLRRDQIELTKRLEESIARLQKEREALQAKLSTEEQTSTQSRRRVEELESRLSQNSTELAKAKEECEKHRAERERAESEWRKRLETAESRRREIEAVGAKGEERSKSFEEQLELLRQERDQIRAQLETEQRAAAESKKRSAEMEGQLRKVTGELDALKAETGQLRARLGEAEKAAERAGTALQEEVGRREGFENRSSSLQLQQLEKEQRFERQIADLRKERDDLRDKLVAEQHALVETGRRIEAMESSHNRSATEFERTKTELEQQLAEREKAEATWRKQLEAAGAQRTEVESAWAEANEITQRLEADLAGLRQERDELSGKLAAEQLAATDAKRRIEDLRTRLTQTTVELEQSRAESSEQSLERRNSESQWEQQVNAANARRQKIESALAEAMERGKAFEEEAVSLRDERDELGGRLASEHRVAAESIRRVEAAERRASQTAAELARVQKELEDQSLERERLESESQQQLNVAKSRKEKTELALAGAMERHKRLEEELVALRQEADELNDKLVGEHRATVESVRRAEAAERRVTQCTAELERVKAELEKQAEERESAEEEWREQLAASKALSRKLETAWTGAVERSKRVEAELSSLRQEVEELNGKLTAEQSAASEWRRRAETAERRARQHAMELERTRTGAESSDAEHGRSAVEYASQRPLLKTPIKAAPASGTKPLERRNSVRGDSYSTPLHERYNLQP